MTTELIIPGSGREVVVRVAAAFGFAPDDLTGRSRFRRIVRARNAAVWVLRRQATASGLPRSYLQLALLLGGRDHSSVMYGEKRCAAWMAAEPAYRVTVEALLAGLAPVFVRPIERESLPPVLRKLGPPRAVADLPARAVKRKNAMADDDLGAVDRYNGSQRLLAAINAMRAAA